MIELNDFRRQWHVIREDALRVVDQVGASGHYILDTEVRRFEQVLAAFWGVREAVGTGNGLDALEIALRAGGLRTSERVLTTPLSAFATTLAICRAGGTPVFVDVDPAGLLDLDRCEDALRSNPDIRFLVPVHLYGFCIDLMRLGDLRRTLGLVIVEDCAQSIGASFAGIGCGTVGEAAITSFYPTKNLGAIGDGGALLTDQPEAAARARSLRNYGSSRDYLHDVMGLNSRLDELHAALLREVFLPRLSTWTALRRRVASTYLEGIHNPAIRLPSIAPECVPSWHLFPIVVDFGQRESLVSFLAHRDIRTGAHYPILIPEQAALRHQPFELIGDLWNARSMAGGEVSLPIHPFLHDEEMQAVVTACNEWRP